jgi:hypothetical protein
MEAGKAVAWLFTRAKRQLAGVIAAGGWPAEVVVGSSPQSPTRAKYAVEALEQSSGPIQWTRAIECPAHDFHAQWAELKRWALKEGLYLGARTKLDPVYNSSVYLLVVWPAADV